MAIVPGDIVVGGFVGPRHSFHHDAAEAWPMRAAHREQRAENQDEACDCAGDQ
jgi:hypothetical protein